MQYSVLRNTRYCNFFRKVFIAVMSKKKTVTSKAFRFTPAELELLEKHAAGHGSYKDAIMAGLRALDTSDNAAVSEALATELEKLARNIREGLK